MTLFNEQEAQQPDIFPKQPEKKEALTSSEHALQTISYQATGDAVGVSPEYTGELDKAQKDEVFRSVAAANEEPRSLEAEIDDLLALGLSEDEIIERGARFIESAGLVQFGDTKEIFDPIFNETFRKVGPNSYQSIDTGRMISPDRSVVERKTAEFLVDTLGGQQTAALMGDEKAKGVFTVENLKEETAVAYKIAILQNKVAKKYREKSVAGVVGEQLPFHLPVYTWFLRGEAVGETVTPGFMVSSFIENFKGKSAEDQLAQLAIIEDGIESGEVNDAAVAEMLGFLDNVDMREANAEVLWDLLEVTGLAEVGALVKGLRSGRKVSDVAAVAKNTEVREKRLADLEDTVVKDVEQANEYLELALPQTLRGDTLEETSVATKHQQKLIKAKKDLVEVLESRVSTRLTEDEAAAGVPQTVRRIYHELSLGRPPEDDLVIAGIDRSAATGRTLVTARIGKNAEDLRGFSSSEAANKHAQTELGLEDGFYSVGQHDGQWWVEVTRDLEENGLIETGGKALLGESMLAGAPMFGKVLGKKTLADLDFSSQFSLSRGLEERVRVALGELAKTTDKLSSKQQESLGKIIALGRTDERWYTHAELTEKYETSFGRKPTQKEIDAYDSYKARSDFNYLVFDNEVVTQLVRNGYQEFSTKNANGFLDVGNGKVVSAQSVKNPEHYRFRSAEKGIHDVGSHNIQSLSALEEKGWKIMKLDQPRNFGEGNVDYLLVAPGESISFRPIRYGQLNYVQGGPRIYSGNWFIKQPEVRNGIKFSDKTVFNLVDKSEAVRYADEYNEALAAWKKAKQSGRAEDILTATNLISRNTRYADFKAFDDAILEGKMNDAPFEVVQSGGHTTGGIDPDTLRRDDSFFEYSDSAAALLQSGRMWYSKRGEHLLHPKEGLAEIVDPFKSMSIQATSAVKTLAYGDFKVRQAERWVRAAGADVVSDGNPVSTALYGELRDRNIDPKRLQYLETSRQIFKQALGTPTVSQRAAQRLTERMVEFLDIGLDKTPLKATGKSLSRKLDRTSKDPVTAMRAMNYNMLLGLGDISQTVMQTSMIPAVVAVSPKNGLKALGAYPFIRRLMANDTPKVLESTAKWQKFLTGIEPDTFKAMWKDIKQSGQNLVGGTQAQLDNFSNVAEVNNVPTKWTKGAIEKSRFFFNEAETANMTVAATISWLDRGGRALKSVDDWRAFAARAETLAGNMTKTGNAWWQQGMASVPTQFAAHPLRVFEILATKQGGGLTKAEKARYVAALSVVYGAGGVPFATYTYNKLNDALGRNPTKEEHAAITRGLYGVMLPDTDVSRLQPFAQETIIEKLLDPETKLHEAALGPSGNLLSAAMKAGEGVKVMAKVMAGDEELVELGVIDDLDPTTVVLKMLDDLGKGVASYRRGTQWWLAHKTGDYISSSGMRVDAELSKIDAALVGFGLPPMRSKEAYEGGFGLINVKERDRIINQVAKKVAPILKEAMEAKSPEVRKQKLALVHAYASVFNGKKGYEGGVSQDTADIMKRAQQLIKFHTYSESQWLRVFEDASVDVEEVFIYHDKDK